MNKMIEKLSSTSKLFVQSMKDKIQMNSAIGKSQYGEGKYVLKWQNSQDPYHLIEVLESETSTLLAQIEKEKARLAILRMSYRQ